MRSVCQGALLRSFLLGTAGLAVVGGGLNAPAFGQEASEANDSVNVVDTIVVTATRREESVQDVPISISAFSNETLRERGIRDFSELAVSTPSVALQEGGPGYRTVYLRGVGTGTINTTSTTGFYYDESYIEPGGLVLGIIEPLFFDVNRVEVLRGPQGTLFGGSSMGGTLRFISNTPNMSEFEGAVGVDASFTEDGGFNYETSGVINIPIIEDKLALRATANYRDNDGFIDRIVTDPSGAVTEDENVDSNEFFGARVMLEAQPTDSLMVRLTGVVQESDADAWPVIDQFPGDEAVQARTVNFDDFFKDDFNLANLLVTYDFGNFELLSSTSQNSRDVDTLEDSDGDTFFGITDIFVIAERAEESFTQELRLTSNLPGSLNFVVGALYEEYSRDGKTSFFGSNDVAEDFLFFPISTGRDRTQVAVFGEVTYDITPKLTATAGVRYYEYEEDQINNVANTTSEASEDGFSPRFVLEYDVLDDVMLYTSAARGFRPGGARRSLMFDEDTTIEGCRSVLGIEIGEDGSLEGFESDELWSYEVGAKSVFAGGRAKTNVAAFYTDWRDIQLFAAYPDPCQTSFLISNVASAEIYGVEADFDVAVTDALSITGGFSYTEAETTEDVPGSLLVKGSPLQNVPDWTANLNGRYTREIAGYDGFALLSYRYTGESSSVIVPSTNPPEQEAYGIVNARFGASKNNLEFSLYVNNLTNELPLRTYFATSLGSPRENEKYFTERPRTVGVAIRKDF